MLSSDFILSFGILIWAEVRSFQRRNVAPVLSKHSAEDARSEKGSLASVLLQTRYHFLTRQPPFK